MELEQRAYELAGQPFNLASPKQLGEVLFDKLGLEVVSPLTRAKCRVPPKMKPIS